MADISYSPAIIVNKLLENDPFSQWMGIDIVAVSEGNCTLTCEITESMLNGFKVVHGGIIFSLADTALAFSAATTGRVGLALDNSISYTRKAKIGDTLTARSEAVNLTNRTGVFDVRITNQLSETVAFMKGTVYRTKDLIFENDPPQ